jgi:5'-nucleotidase
VAALVRQYKALLAPISSKVIGTIAVPLPNSAGSTGESELGDLVADSLAHDPTAAGGGTPDVAFMNRRGIRAGFTQAGNVTFGRAYIVKPPNTSLVSMSMSGQQIIDLLNQQWSGPNVGKHRKTLQVSDGFSYRWQATPAGPVLDESSVQINGAPLVKTQTYRVVANNFLSAGGDGFAAFASATNKIVGALDLDAFVGYLQSYTTNIGPWAPPTTPRITAY